MGQSTQGACLPSLGSASPLPQGPDVWPLLEQARLRVKYPQSLVPSATLHPTSQTWFFPALFIPPCMRKLLCVTFESLQTLWSMLSSYCSILVSPVAISFCIKISAY